MSECTSAYSPLTTLQMYDHRFSVPDLVASPQNRQTLSRTELGMSVQTLCRLNKDGGESGRYEGNEISRRIR